MASFAWLEFIALAAVIITTEGSLQPTSDWFSGHQTAARWPISRPLWHSGPERLDVKKIPRILQPWRRLSALLSDTERESGGRVISDNKGGGLASWSWAGGLLAGSFAGYLAGRRTLKADRRTGLQARSSFALFSSPASTSIVERLWGEGTSFQPLQELPSLPAITSPPADAEQKRLELIHEWFDLGRRVRRPVRTTTEGRQRIARALRQDQRGWRGKLRLYLRSGADEWFFSDRLGSKGAKLLAYALVHYSNVHTVTLSGTLVKEQGAKWLSLALRLNDTLRTLRLNGNEIRDDGAVVLSRAVKYNRSLLHLSLWNNKFTMKGAREVAKIIRRNNQLESLDLDRNLIGVEGAKLLADALQQNTNLRSLSLCNNNIGVELAVAMAEALKVNTSLTTLRLGGNRIPDSGVVALADALKVNSTLQSLHLWGNGIGPHGARVLARVLRTNTTLHTLDLQWNCVGNSGFEALRGVLAGNSSLRALNLQNNNIDGAMASQSFEALPVERSDVIVF